MLGLFHDMLLAPQDIYKLSEAKKLNLMALYRQYAPFAAIGLVLLVVVYVKFFW